MLRPALVLSISLHATTDTTASSITGHARHDSLLEHKRQGPSLHQPRVLLLQLLDAWALADEAAKLIAGLFAVRSRRRGEGQEMRAVRGKPGSGTKRRWS